MKTKLALALSCAALLATSQIATAGDSFSKPLRQQSNPQIQQLLEQRIADLHLTRATRNKQLSVALVDITDPNAPAMAQINGDEMMYAASLPKIAILLAAFERIREGKLKLTDDMRQTMTSMIRRSSNQAATKVIRAVGINYINQVLKSDKYRLYDPKHNGGLWVGKEYASGVAKHRDPLHNISHGATALQTARFYYMLESGKLVSPEYSRQMKTMLGNPGINHKFVKGLSQSSPDALIFRKSGSWRDFHADSALIEHNGRRYIAVALANNPKGGEWMTRLIQAMNEIIVDLHPGVVAGSVHASASQAVGVAEPRSSSKHLM
ncbi:serine hydrolase [Mariprofundus sp. KV]|uniref:serine hydrolase n=1 Tax=Mariprofundus sp. KV TaxID=2608715 RepID=UPI0015A4BC61|nr:serine hydrolase [Mariprofundus sp. KV]NWF36474.1 serine hydrolase [Mariprofundus sp. KV]